MKIIQRDGNLLADSREVAEMLDKRHTDLLRSIDGYIEILLNAKMRSVDFFIENTYQDSTGRTLPCYLLTKKGCDMVANKMTGEKGVLFTATYVTKFEEMEKKINKPLSQLEILQVSINQLIEQENRVKKLEDSNKKLEEGITTIKETFLQKDDDWRKAANAMLNSAAKRTGENYRDLRVDSYRLLEERAKCNLTIRVNNLKQRLEETGATKTRINQTTKMDVIEQDARLKEIYTTIVKEFSIGTLQF